MIIVTRVKRPLQWQYLERDTTRQNGEETTQMEQKQRQSRVEEPKPAVPRQRH
ncbi:hypothetical protein DPMN_047166 [Dreissena polymorpha]|uniref:Uncharacterized protein n=1 Tax=Dreissena polymorpha TaxID=45954 RepID=A0A9D4D889_DREPO|nr:hypothetical protein DPMN_047166 [Dreissena polymorpha]